MRPIIFRGKLKDKEQADFFNNWVYGDLIHYGDGSVWIRQQETGQELEIIPETVGQFTGLSDNNEVDVYEGDEIIGVCILTDANGYDTRFDVHGVVKYSDDFSGLIFTETVKMPVENYGSFMYQLKYFKVIVVLLNLLPPK